MNSRSWAHRDKQLVELTLQSCAVKPQTVKNKNVENTMGIWHLCVFHVFIMYQVTVSLLLHRDVMFLSDAIFSLLSEEETSHVSCLS